MKELISILLKVGDSDLDEHTARFIASAGLLVASTDEDINKEEYDKIIQSLAALKIFPKEFLDEIIKGDVAEIFNESVQKMLEINPGLKEGMLQYMIQIVLSDKIIAKEEVELIYQFGNSIGLSDMEVATAIAESIQQCYVPSLDAIC